MTWGRKNNQMRFESNVIEVGVLMNTEQETCENEKDEGLKLRLSAYKNFSFLRKN